MTDDPPEELSEEEIKAGYRWTRLGTGPWRKLAPGQKTAREYLDEHRKRTAAIDAVVDKLKR